MMTETVQERPEEKFLDSIRGETRLEDSDYLTSQAAALNHIETVREEIKTLKESKKAGIDKKRVRQMNRRIQNLEEVIREEKKKISLRYRCDNCEQEFLQNLTQDKKCPECEKRSLEVIGRV
jgi:flagellar biosynthesis chaperone FliJ